MWYGIPYKFYCNLLSCISCYSIWFNGEQYILFLVNHCTECKTYFLGCSGLYMCFCDITSHLGWNFAGSKSIWPTRLSLPSKCCTKTNTRKKMVYGTINNHHAWWNIAFWIYIYRNVYQKLYHNINLNFITYKISFLGILFSLHSGLIKFITFMDLCC